MGILSILSVLTAIAASVLAQDASDADAALVRQQLINVVAATTSLDNTVLAYTGPSDSANLQAASEAVIASLNAGISAVAPIQGFITINQAATQLLDQVDALNTIVDQAVQDVINQKTLLATSCLGPTILAQLQLQSTAASAFRDAITLKFAAENRDLANLLSQPALDSLTGAIQEYSDQTSLPASCQEISSVAPTPSPPIAIPPSALLSVSADVSTTVVASVVASTSSIVVTSSVDSIPIVIATIAPATTYPASTSSAASVTPSIAASSRTAVASTGGTTGAPSRSISASREYSKTIITTTICHADVCTQKLVPTKSNVNCYACEGSATTSPITYTGGAVVGSAGSNVLSALLGFAAIMVL